MTHLYRFLLLPLLFLSGAAGLAYEVFWLKKLLIAFGSTAHSSAVVVSVFFGGMAAGYIVWGRIADRLPNPVRMYGILEIGIGVTSLLYFAATPIMTSIIGALGVSAPFPVVVLVKILSSVLLLAPSTFLMGGTIPMLVNLFAVATRETGRAVGLLYAVNTFGAVAGAIFSGFYLPYALGYTNSLVAVAASSITIGLLAIVLSRLSSVAGASSVATGIPTRAPVFAQPGSESEADNRGALLLAGLSGFVVLALEVAWTRMFSQVFQNSVYAFSAILAVLLVALSAGSAVSTLTSRIAGANRWYFPVLLTLCGVSTALTPFLLFVTTRGYQGITLEGTSWSTYISALFLVTAKVIAVPAILAGMVLPSTVALLKSSPGHTAGMVGQPLFVNTLCGIAGSVLAGFVLFDKIGVFGTVLLCSALYLLASFAAARKIRRPFPVRFSVPLAGALCAFAIGAPSTVVPPVAVDISEGEKVVYYKDGCAATVSVTERPEGHSLHVNNLRVQGGTQHARSERLFSELPLLLHGSARDICHIGLGTGITAGASLQFPVRSVVVAEIAPEVVAAAQRFFAPHCNGLFSDQRVRIVREDGRLFMRTTRDSFDLVIGDLFFPEESASLYTSEHFRSVRSHLRRGGMFVQWIPLYQMSEREFLIIVKNMTAVFPQVTMWRGDFFPVHPAIALIGQLRAGPARIESIRAALACGTSPLSDMVADSSGIPWTLYAGNLTSARALYESSSDVHTDARPLIEFLAPRLPYQRNGAGAPWLTGGRLSEFYARILQRAPLQSDPFCRGLNEKELSLIVAGQHMFADFCAKVSE